MAVKLYRCSNQWAKFGGHPCWKVERRPDRVGSRVRARARARSSRASARTLFAGTGQRLYPAIEFEDGTWYREQSKDMVRTIRDGKLMERAGGSAPAEASLH